MRTIITYIERSEFRVTKIMEIENNNRAKEDVPIYVIRVITYHILYMLYFFGKTTFRSPCM